MQALLLQQLTFHLMQIAEYEPVHIQPVHVEYEPDICLLLSSRLYNVKSRAGQVVRVISYLIHCTTIKANIFEKSKLFNKADITYSTIQKCK